MKTILIAQKAFTRSLRERREARELVAVKKLKPAKCKINQLGNLIEQRKLSDQIGPFK